MAFFDDLPSKLNSGNLSIGHKRMLQIVEGAIQVFVKIGIEQATYAKIATASHVSRPLIQHYFPSKKQIIEASFKYIRSVVQSQITDYLTLKSLDCKNTKEFFLEYIAIHFETFTKKNLSYMHVGFLFLHYSGVDSRLKAHNSTFVRLGFERLKGIIEKGIADKSFGISINEVGKVARMIQLLLTGAFVSVATEIPENVMHLQKNITATCLQLLKAN